MLLTFRRAIGTDVPELAPLAARTFPLACPPELDRAAIDSFIADNLSEDAFRRYLDARGHTVLVGVDAGHRDDSGDSGDGGGHGDHVTGDVARVRAYALLIDGTMMSEDCADMIALRPTVGVSKFYVDPELHGAGVARGLFEACVARVRDDGARSLWLATNVGNRRARTFYGKNGFIERGSRVFTVGGIDNDDVVLERPL